MNPITLIVWYLEPHMPLVFVGFAILAVLAGLYAWKAE